ncbi:hypothetical protein ACWGLF_19055 [Streptomyces puniciscabiei]|uniref:hypothetical protein n=1 Tax=Streptomyces puniciscabiei TaxID=164348 RepID=UPI003320B624
MSYKLRPATFALSIGLILTLPACGSDERPGAPTKTGRAAPSTAAPSPTSSTNADGTLKGGTTLKLGQAALLRYDTGDLKGTLQVTVTRIEKGSSADLKVLSGLSKDALRATPYYVHSVIKNAGTTDLSHAPIDPPTGVLKDGTQARGLSVIGTFDKCDAFPKTAHFRPGASYESCSPVLADPGATVTGAAWTGQGYDDLPSSAGVSWTQ